MMHHCAARNGLKFVSWVVVVVCVQASELQALEERLEGQAAAAKQAEDNARAAEKKAAEQATIAAAARAEVRTGSSMGASLPCMVERPNSPKTLHV